MNRFNELLMGALLSTFLALMINLLSNFIWEILFKRPLNKFVRIILIIIVFMAVIAVVFIQNSAYPLPSGIDKESVNLKAAWNNKGFAFYKQGDYSHAIDCYEKAIKIDSGYVLAWSNKGNALNALNRRNEAEMAFSKARGEL